MLRSILAAAAFTVSLVASMATPAIAAGGEGCPPEQPTTGIRWYVGLKPGDDLMTAWCRIQAIPGAVRFNIAFPSAGAHKTWETSFESGLPAARIVEIVQSLIPTADGPLKDENGMPFARVLQSVAQVGAQNTPDGSREMNLPSMHPASRDLILWEPIQLRIRPINLGGADFAMTVGLTPNLGFYALARQGYATDIRFNGWKGRMAAGGWLGRGCAAALPYCDEIPEIAQIMAPWVVTYVQLETEGENLTATAATIMERLSRSPARNVSGSKFVDPHTGTGNLEMSDDMTRFEMKAEGDGSGTRSISLLWSTSSGPNPLRTQFDRAFNDFRAAGPGATPTETPDALDLL